MRFTKPALSVTDQVKLLQARGMQGDPDRMARRLRYVNYYRLSAYWHTFRAPGRDDLLPGTDFEVVWDRYVFDRRLRLLVMDAVERVEVALRARLANVHALTASPFAYESDPAALFPSDAARRSDFLRRLDEDLRRTHEGFIPHFNARYGDTHPRPPIWVAAEVLSFGGVVSLFRGSSRQVQRAVADAFGVPAVVFESWLLCLNQIRNICAHHSRLWNRELGFRPKVPRPDVTPSWHNPVTVKPDRVFVVLTILAHCLHHINPGTSWARRFVSLLDRHPTIPPTQMGLPASWRSSPVWAPLLGPV